MTDHSWAQEHIAAAVADGLTPEETERLDDHLQTCQACAAVMGDAHKLNNSLGSLFAPVRPSAALEDGIIQTLRVDVARRRVLSGWRRKLAVGIAASVGIGLTGAAVGGLAGVSDLPFPAQRVLGTAKEAAPVSGTHTVIDDSASMSVNLGKRLRTEIVAEIDNNSSLRGYGLATQLYGNSNATPGEAKQAGESIPAVQSLGATAYIGNAGGDVEGKDTTSGRRTGEEPPGLQDDPRVKSPDDRSGKSHYFSTWGTSSYTGSGAVHLQVGDTLKDGGPGISPVDPNATRAPHVQYQTGGQSISSWGTHLPSSLNPNKENELGRVDNNAANPASGKRSNDFGISGRFGDSVGESLPERERSQPSSGGRKQSSSVNDRSFGYINPSDFKPAPASSESLGRGKGEGKQVAPHPGQVLTHPDKEQQLARGEPPASSDAAKAVVPSSADADRTAPRKIVIRSGEIEFEVESFDSAVATVTRLVTGINGAFVATVNSEKLPNGKVKGSIALRVPPDHLDALVLDLRKEIGKAGDLKGQRIGSQDISKQYTDLESRLRAARTMETRLLQIIKEGKGEIKQLLEAEKELGVWRTRIEECEGELRYYGNLVALSTLTVTLAEREIRSAATTTESERVQAGVEVEDVDKALQQALAAITEAKGRVTKSELKQLAAGQFNAELHCELAPAAAGPFRDRLHQLGRVARLEIDRVQKSDGGAAVQGAKVTRGDTQFLVQFYNLANVAPREVTTLVLAMADVPAGYQAVREAVGKSSGRVIVSRLDEQDRQNVTAQLDFEVRRTDESALQTALATAGEVVSRNVTRAADGENLTDAKVLFHAALVSAARVKPRETTTLALEVSDVDAATAVIGAQVAEAKGRTVDAQASHERAGRVTARLVYDVPFTTASALVEKLKAAGVTRVQQTSRDLQAPDGRFATARLEVTLSNTDLIVAMDDGLWPQVRRGLSVSVAVLLMSVTWVVFGLCVVVPWALVGYGGYRLFRRLAPRSVSSSPSIATPGPGAI